MQMYNITSGTLTPAEKIFVETTPEMIAANDIGDMQKLALVLTNDIDLNDIDFDFSKIGAVILSFPSFGDGRAYSQAHLLRNRYGFQGYIIARGDVLPDQLLYMKRCGFNAIETDRNDLESYNNALCEFSWFYQKSTDAIEPVWLKRVQRESVAA